MRPISKALALAFLSSFICSFAHAELNIQKDCAQAAQIFKVPSHELSQFQKWCVGFETECYKIEASSAKACGGNGTQEATSREQLRVATESLSSNKSYQAGTAGAIDSLETVILTRKFQLQICHTNLDKCTKMSSTFNSQSGPKTLACKNFTPESEMWEASAKSATDICQATEIEIARVRSELAGAETHKSDYASIKEASGSSRTPTSDQGIRLESEDARACGLFGCEANNDGTFSPRNAPSETSSENKDLLY